jgi:flavodoxin
MKALLLYGSSRGNTRLVAQRLAEWLEFEAELADVKDAPPADRLARFDLLIFLASTWGDGELQVDMEHFLARPLPVLDGKAYTICELGNYYGYDDFEFGALHIMQRQIRDSGAVEWYEPFCMDSLPRKDWGGLKRWCAGLNRKAGAALG